MLFVATYCEEPTTSHGNFTPSLSRYRAGTIVHLTCDLGYEPISDVSTTCQECMIWDPSVPNCTLGKEVYVIICCRFTCVMEHGLNFHCKKSLH